MEFIKQYLKILSNVCTGLVFAFASFYLLANLYHFFELKKDFYTDFNSELIVTDIDETMRKVNDNISVTNTSQTIPVNDMNLIKQNLANCITSFHNPTIEELRNKNKITIVDVYKLRESYENDILNKCVVNNLYWLLTPDPSYGEYLTNNTEITKLYMDTLLTSSTAYLKKDLLNNSSYYYNTSIASISILDNTRDGFYEVMDAYNRVAKLVLYVSDWYKKEAEG